MKLRRVCARRWRSDYSLSRNNSAAFLIPVRKGTAFAHQAHQQWRGLPVHRAEHLAVLLHAGEQRRQPDRIGVEHGSAAITRESITHAPDDVDVAGPLRDTLLEDAQSLVQQGIDAALEDLLVGMQPLFD